MSALMDSKEGILWHMLTKFTSCKVVQKVQEVVEYILLRLLASSLPSNSRI